MYLAFDIGCLECGELSNPLGIYSTEELAQAACDRAAPRQQADWHGQHHFQVFNLDTDRSIYADPQAV